ncbi:MAG: DUF3726 domain-containing protein [Acidimicrobiales bacterium]|nr:DUF3726 domain-containing protein [Hyphomonadaceae bacterium]RZV44638.1 MAG: DUF3726 domain-containing protein [Acidimicrobiales bacterium]
MSTILNLSHNELSSLLKLALQGLFQHSQDWGDLAKHILWLETHGFAGVASMKEALESTTFRGFDGDISKTPNGLCIDFNNNSLLMGLPMLVDLVTAMAAKEEHCYISLINVHDFEAVVSVDAALRAQGLDVYVDANEMTISSQSDGTNILFDFAGAHECYDQSLRDGIPMDQEMYQFLDNLAKRTLVEATEESRRGAGE